MDDTLADNAWIDSFDNLLKLRPALRELKVLKKNVRASFNLDSSVENCKPDNDSCEIRRPSRTCRTTRKDHAAGGKSSLRKKRKTTKKSISTPVADKRLSKLPFKCSLSPISAWQLDFQNAGQKRSKHDDDRGTFHATLINSDSTTVEFDTILEEQKRVQDKTFSPQFSVQKLVSERRTAIANLRKRNKLKVAFDVAPNASQAQRTRSEVFLQQPQAPTTRPASLMFAPGKWRKSLSAWRRTHQQPLNCRRSSREQGCGTLLEESVEFVGVTKIIGGRKSMYIKDELRQSDVHREPDCRLRVLQQCGQQSPLPFKQAYMAESMLKCRKIGEGAYGEVFMYAATQSDAACDDTVIKIIPIEGAILVNGEVQKTFQQILPEIVISARLSALRGGVNKNATCGFADVRKVACVEGEYPQHLVELWEEYDKKKESENDHPEIFTPTQLYIVLELGFGGCDLETFVFNNAEQAYCALLQVILTLAVGEEAYQFEHRDLHSGNVLVLKTNAKSLDYKLSGGTITIPTKGVQTTIIDYTLSRMVVDDVCYYNDLAIDEDLFGATGDYQFDIYRMMREVLKNNWATYEPVTNIFWISYVIAKMIQGVVYKNTRSKTHTTYMRKLEELKANVLRFRSAAEYALYLNAMT